ncbi:hypothetical protein [Streptomyces pakalii]|uniref:Uncharacterized protein n=1 Tax=Streptomyces pakalii TaxID=3036494 RepID=A0ABT7D1Y9_9ACTN|nr:hypothetical protein [Streptomyces pakalii]MDJ1639802.1 hypothetical protein [Streptomyces pakalii]
MSRQRLGRGAHRSISRCATEGAGAERPAVVRAAAALVTHDRAHLHRVDRTVTTDG